MKTITINIDDDLSGLNNDEITNYVKLGKFIMDNVMIKMKIDKADDELLGDIKDVFTQKIDDLTQSVNTRLFKYSENSQKKGEYNQHLIEEIYSKYFLDITFEDKSKEPHCGDAFIYSDSFPKTLIELKNYQCAVPTKEVEKFKLDMNSTGLKYGIFIATGNITKKPKCLSVEQFENKTLVYLPNANEASIISATLIVKNLEIMLSKKYDELQQSNIVNSILSRVPILNDKINMIENFRQKLNTKKKTLIDTLDEFDNDIQSLYYDLRTFINDIDTEIG